MSFVLDLLHSIPTWHLAGLFVAGMIAFIISTISGGGGAVLLVPVTSSMIGVAIVPPVINVASFMSNASRLYLFWNDIDWSLTKYYVPSAILGAWLAALVFSRLDANWIQLLVGAFLVSTIFQYKFGKV
ncbi:TSUP family transporter, partial [Psychrobacter sp. AOP7-B1-24]